MFKIENAMVTMRDGIRLATDIYLPEKIGHWPVVLERTPYDKSNHSRSEVDRHGRKLGREAMAQAFVDRGFAIIFQDCRGRYQSEGTFIKYIHEAEDGVDTLEWIREQPWCNGRIGTMGLSYAAHTQLALACLAPAGLACMVLDSGGFSNAFESGIRQGGAFELKQATWAFKQAAKSPEAHSATRISAALAQEDICAWFRRMPWIPGHSPLRHVPAYESYLFEQWQHGRFDEYWKKLGIYAKGYYDTIPDIPMMFVSSWYDAYVRSTLENYTELKRRHRSDKQLIMGPWLHGDRNTPYSGDVDFGEQAYFDGNIAPSWLEHRLQWFERYLANKPHKPSMEGVCVFMMGGGSGLRGPRGRMSHGGHWMSSPQWPLPDVRQLSLYLTGCGQLTEQPDPSSASKRLFVADPDHPVPTIGGSLTSGGPVFRGGAFDQRETAEFFGSRGDGIPLSARQDVLTFQTDILEEDIHVSGPVAATLYIETSAPDTDFTAKLIDVYPPNDDYPHGYAMNITDGIFRCRYHRSYAEPTKLTPRHVYTITVEPFATCNLFKRGHRIRLDVSGSNFPKFDVNPNSGEEEGSSRLKERAINTVHTSREWPSHMTLGVIKEPRRT
ncbi:CocE/NonD family hydrolase [Halomonas sp. HNIBRBA4712]|uniref:CocE/NonD family hydrolase n=1 Tax=Halomonas sp. HNIBRBA4712 TaxID=3373087 RepID=UPI0037454DEF